MRYKESINLKLYKYENNAFVLQAIIDDYQEISFAHNLYEAGDFTITINYNIPNALKFERGMWVQFGNDPYMFGEILSITDSIGADGKGSQIRSITGKDARFIFKRRVIKNLNNEENWAMTAKGEIVLRSLIDSQCGSGAESKRQLPITNIIPGSENALGEEYSCAEAFSNLYDTLVTIATQSGIGWRVKFDSSLILEVYQGSDLSNQVQFSTDYDSLSNGQFSDSSESFANTVYVGGKGTGSDRDLFEGENAIEGNSPAGFDRYEAYDNQSSMTSESEYEAEALSMLTQYGQTINVSGNGLAQCPYIFKEQYNIGDIITLAFSGKSAKTQILSVTEHWSWGQYGIEFSFGKPQNDLSRQLQLILKQIQKASSKTESTSSVKYYTIPTDTQMPKSDVIYDTIGFTGACAAGGSTFQLYWDSDKTGAKTYHVWFKQLSGGKLTLTTGVSGKANLVLNSGTYVAIIYVDAEGNVLSQGATATNTIEAGNTQPATSGAVNAALSTKVDTSSIVDKVSDDDLNPVTSNAVADALNVPTDAVLHYSFDDIPDLPDGTADARFIDGNTYGLQSTNYKFNLNNMATISNNNGRLQIDITGAGANGVYILNSQIENKILIIDINVTSLVGDFSAYNGSDTIIQTFTKVGKYRICYLHRNTQERHKEFYFMCRRTGNSCTFTIENIYIGDGSYSTPIIDNSGNGKHATNNGAIAVQGVSGKSGFFPSDNQSCSIQTSQFPKPTSDKPMSISLWIKFDENYTVNDSSGRPICSIGEFGGLFGIIRVYNLIFVTAKTSTRESYVTFQFSKGVMYHVVFVYNAERRTELYINGVRIGVSAVVLDAGYTFGGNNTIWNIWTNKYVAGSAQQAGSRMATLDDLLIFNRALSAEEVQALYLNKANTPKYYNTNNYNLNKIKEITAQSTDFADFQARMAGLTTRSLPPTDEPTEEEQR